MIPPALDDAERSARLAPLIAVEIDRIVEDLEVRRAYLVELWGRCRDRGPFLDTVFSRWRSLDFRELAVLEVDVVMACEAFYRELDDLRLYFRFTEDMPATLDERIDGAMLRLSATGRHAIAGLGGVPERPMVEFPEDVELTSIDGPGRLLSGPWGEE